MATRISDFRDLVNTLRELSGDSAPWIVTDDEARAWMRREEITLYDEITEEQLSGAVAEILAGEWSARAESTVADLLRQSEREGDTPEGAEAYRRACLAADPEMVAGWVRGAGGTPWEGAILAALYAAGASKSTIEHAAYTHRALVSGAEGAPSGYAEYAAGQVIDLTLALALPEEHARWRAKKLFSAPSARSRRAFSAVARWIREGADSSVETE